MRSELIIYFLVVTSAACKTRSRDARVFDIVLEGESGSKELLCEEFEQVVLRQCEGRSDVDVTCLSREGCTETGRIPALYYYNTFPIGGETGQYERSPAGLAQLDRDFSATPGTSEGIDRRRQLGDWRRVLLLIMTLRDRLRARGTVMLISANLFRQTFLAPFKIWEEQRPLREALIELERQLSENPIPPLTQQAISSIFQEATNRTFSQCRIDLSSCLDRVNSTQNPASEAADSCLRDYRRCEGETGSAASRP